MRRASERRRWLTAAAASVLALAFGGVCAAAPGEGAAVEAVDEGAAAWEREYWYVLSVNDERAGWSRRAQRTLEGGSIENVTELFMRVERMGMELVLHTIDETVETAGGEYVRTRYTQRQNEMTTRETFEFDHEAGEVSVRVDRGEAGGVVERRLSMPEGEWLTPLEAQRLLAARLRAGAERVEYATLLTRGGTVRVVEASFDRTGSTTVSLGEDEVDATLGEMETGELPGTRVTVALDGDGAPVMSDGTIGALRIAERLAEASEALSAFAAPEFMVSSFVRPTGAAIERPREVERALYRLRSRAGELPELPETGVQRVMTEGEGAAVVYVDGSGETAAAAETTAEERASLTAASLIADSEDEFIRRLTEGALRSLDDGASEAERAEALRLFVYGYVSQKDLDTGFASATEVARRRSGDCTEHAVLLAAMLRAAGIASRAANGLIYADTLGGVDADGERLGAFGYHMWTQGLVRGADGIRRWVDLDASWPESMDGTRIATSVSPLRNDDDDAALVSIARLVGNLDIEVLGVDEEAAALAAEMGLVEEGAGAGAGVGAGDKADEGGAGR